MIPSWWRSLLKCVGVRAKDGRRSRRSNSKPRPTARPTFEPLEDRLVPAMPNGGLVVPNVLSILRSSPITPETNALSVIYNVTFNESVTNVVASDFEVVTGASLRATSPVVVGGSGASYTVTVNGIHGNGDLRLDLIDNDTIIPSPAGGIPLGGPGVGNGSFQGQIYNILQADPSVVSIDRSSPAGPSTSASSVQFAVTFSEQVNGVDSGDFQVVTSGGVASASVQVLPTSGPASVYTVTVSGITGHGTLGLNLVDNGSIHDVAGNPLVHPASGIFGTPIFATGPMPVSVALGDFNGDGIPDLAIANGSYYDTVSVALGNGDGTFQSPETFATGYVADSVAVGALTGDGKLDLVVANQSDNTISVLLGNGDGTFQSQTPFSTGGEPGSVALGDLSGDGTLDAVVANYTDSTVSVLLGNGNGTFQAQKAIATGSGPSSVAIGNVNGDSHSDLVVANYTGQSVSVLIGNGNGTFQGQRVFTTGDQPTSVTVSDLTENGKPGIVVADANDDAVGVLLGNGNGTFQGQQTFATGSHPFAVAAQDFNGDGKPDLVVANELDSSLGVLLSNGNGTFQAQQIYAAGYEPRSLAVGDINGDGLPDVVVVNSKGATGNVLLGNGDGTFRGQQSVQTFAVGSRPQSLAISDLNNDGEPDLVFANLGSTDVSVMLANGNGTFQGQRPYSTGDGPASVAVNDVNGDGIPDLIVANKYDDDVGVLLGNGNGTFQAMHTFLAGVAPDAVIAADVNGDGKPDLVVANGGSNYFSVLLNNGNGTFQAQQTFTAGFGGNAVYVTDLNGDGKPDVVLTNNYGVNVFLGNGDGTFQAQQTFYTAGNPFSLAVGDLNGDGRPDIAVVDQFGSTTSVLLGNGDGTFQAQQEFATGSSPQSVSMSDVNGDGNLDLVVASEADNSVSVLLGNGDGTFQAQQTFYAGSFPLVAGAGDLNGDGRPDLAVGDGFDNVSVVLLNSGKGNLTGQVYTIVASSPATHFVVSGAPTTINAGGTVTLTVTAEDQFNGVAATYAGTVDFASTDNHAVLPGPATLAGGLGTFSATLTSTGSQTLTAADTTAASITAGTFSITVSPGPASHFVLSAPAAATAGSGFSFTVTAEDQFNNAATGYLGTVTFSSSDANTLASLPANTTLTLGVGTFNATLVTAGSQKLTATDTTTATLTAATATITVNAVATKFVLSAPAATTAGAPFTFTVAAEDRFNNTATSYAGAVSFSSSDNNALAKLPVSSTLAAGVGTFSATLATAGSQTLSAVDSSAATLSGTVGPITVTGLAATHFAISAPTTAVAGTAFQFTVAAEDPFNNIDANYAGSVSFSSTDSSTLAELPAATTLASGMGTFTGTLVTAGSQTLSATDSSAATLSGSSSGITVNGGTATHFVISAPSTATAGTPFVFTVGAEDQFNNKAASYAGTVDFSSTDTQATLPPTTVLSGGVGTFSATLATSGSQTLTAKDSTVETVSGSSTAVSVSPLAAVLFEVDLPGTVTAGIAFDFTVTAEDQYGNPATGYTGTVDFTSSDHNVLARLPGSSPLDSGIGTFSGTLVTAGSQTLTAMDSTAATLAGASNAVTVSAGEAEHFVVNAPSDVTAGTDFAFTVTAEDQFNNTATTYSGAVNFSSSDSNPMAVLPSSSFILSGIGTFEATLVTAGSQTLTATDNSAATLTGTSSAITVHVELTQFVINAPATATAGTAFEFTVSAEDQFNNTVTAFTGTVALSSSDTNILAGVPTSGQLIGGVGTFSATLVTAGSQTLSATETSIGTVTGASMPITVSALAATHFDVSDVSPATAGSSFIFAVTAEDQFNNTDTSYAGSVSFSSSDNSVLAALPPTSPLVSGAGTFLATLVTAGNQTLTATDVTAGTLTGASGPITVESAAATHFAVDAANTSTAGAAFAFTVTAEDPFNNTATGYAGFINFSSSDSNVLGTLPSTSSLISGVGTFSATLVTAGSQTLTATDSSPSGPSGASNPITVNAVATRFVVSAPVTATAGSGFSFTVTAEDQFNNTATGYSGLVKFSSSDSSSLVTLPGSSSLSFGAGTFSATLVTGGSQTLTATDAQAATLTGASGPITVSGQTATHFAINTAGEATAGSGFVFTVTAEDQFNNTDTSYSGIVIFSTSDTNSQASLPGIQGLTSGLGTFTATLVTAGSQTLTVTDNFASTLSGVSSAITVNAVAMRFVLSAPASATAGDDISFTVTAEDAFNNTATGYTGTLTFSSSDGSAQVKLPGASTLISGVGTFSATLVTVGSQTLAATDDSATTLSGASSAIAVSAQAATHFVVSAPSAATAGTAFDFTVIAEDPFNNTATSYAGSVSFSSSDTDVLATVPGISTLVSGVGTFSATLMTGGSQTLIGTDIGAATLTGSSNTIAVNGAVATHFAVDVPGAATAGTPFVFTVTAEDQYNNTATGYGGLVTFSSSDSNVLATLPASSLLAGGVGTFSATLVTAGSQTITATDNSAATLAGVSSAVTVNAVATRFVVNAPAAATAGIGFDFTVTAEDRFNNTATTYSGTVNFSSSDSNGQATLPVGTTLVLGVGTFSATLVTAGSLTLTATDSGAVTLTGVSSAIAVSAQSATHFVVAAPAEATAGSAFSFTVIAEDPFNNTATTYSGTVNFSSSDSSTLATIPASGTVVAGVATFSATLVTAGSQTITATDSGAATLTGASSTITVNGAAASHFVVSAAAATTAGSAFAFTVTAEDQFNNSANDYTGSVSFSSSDNSTLATLPANSGLTSGVGTFSATLVTAGSQTLSATDSSATTITGTSSAITVNVVATQFVVSAPSSATAGTPFNFTVTAEDRFNNTATNYSGTVTFSSSDPGNQPTLPTSGVLLSGMGTFSATLVTAGSQTLTATDISAATLAGASNAVLVNPLSASQFVVSAPTTAAAGVGFSVTVVAEDKFNNTATDYSGSVSFSSSDTNPDTTLPASSSLNSGVGTFSATLASSGSQTLTVVDNSAATLTGASSPITVSVVATRFVFSTPATATAGSIFSFTVTAEDRFNNTATGYSGTVDFSSSDSNALATLPAHSTLISGVGTFSATLVTAGSQTLTATDDSAATLSGASNGIIINPLAASHFVVSAPTLTTAGNLLPFTVTAEDPYNNVDTAYAGTVSFSSSDSSIQATLPASGTLVSGVGSFSATLVTAGSQTLTAMDISTATITGASNTIAVTGAAATHLTINAPTAATAGAAFAFTVAAEDQFNNVTSDYTGTLTFTSSDASVAPGAGLPVDNTLSGGLGVFSATLQAVGGQSLTATDTQNAGIQAATGPIVVSAAPASHFAIAAPSASLAGSGFLFTVLAEDRFNNPVSSYAGTVTFASTDLSASLPLAGVVTSGLGIFSATLVSVGSQTLVATDSNILSITGASGTITVSPAPVNHFGLSSPTTALSGVGFPFTVTALDQFNNSVQTFSAFVTFSSSDNGPGTTLPVTSRMISGLGVFSATLSTLGSQTLTATDRDIASLTASSGPINVLTGIATHFVINAPVAATAGTAFDFTVTAENQFNGTATGYTGAITFSTGDSIASLPGVATLSSGVGTFSATLNTAGSWALTATDTQNSTLSTATGAIAVSPAGASQFVLLAAGGGTTVAGNPLPFAVAAEDPFNNIVSGFSGTVVLSSSDSQASFPTSVVLESGTGYFAVDLKTAGNQIVTATDAVAGTITSGTSAVTVTPAATSQFAVVNAALPTYPGVASAYAAGSGAASSFITAGSPLNFSVVALDAYGNIVPTYNGTVTFAVSDPSPGVGLPINSVLTSGIGDFDVTFQTPGTQTLTVTDANNATLTGTSPGVAVRGLVVTGFSPTPTGFSITFNNSFVPGLVNMYSSGTLPDDILLTSNTALGQVSIRGSVIFGSDNNSLTFVKTAMAGASGAFTPSVGLLSAGKYTVTLRSYNGTSGFQDLVGSLLDGTNTGQPGTNYQFTFNVTATPASTVAVGLPDFARGPSNTDAIFISPSVTDNSTFALSYTNPNANPQAGTATVTFSTNAATLQNNIQAALTTGGLATQIGSLSGAPNAVVVVTNDTPTGANVLVTFQNSLAASTNEMLTSTTSGVSISVAPINVANNQPQSGIPITISGLSANETVTSGSFVLQYNPALLSISGVTTALTVAGASFSIVSNIVSGSLGELTLSLSSPTPINTAPTSATPITLGTLLATVPISATADYGAKQLLHFSSEQLNVASGGTPVTVVNQDAVQVVAYLGDVLGTGGPFSQGDVDAIATQSASLPNRVLQTMPGFAAFPNLDPVIIGDVSLQGTVNITNAGVLKQEINGTLKTTIPYLPAGLSITPAGPDPTLSVPAQAAASVGQTVNVPVNIDTAHPAGSKGMVDAMLALSYDPRLYSVSVSDITLGSVPAAGSDWQLSAAVNQATGQIGIELSSTTGIHSTAAGSLVNITMHVLAPVAGGTSALDIVPFVDPSGGARVFATQLSDGNGAFVLHTATGVQPVPPEQQLAALIGTSLQSAEETASPLASIGLAEHEPAPSSTMNRETADIVAWSQFILGNETPTPTTLESASDGPLASAVWNWLSDGDWAELAQGLASSRPTVVSMVDATERHMADDELADMDALFANLAQLKAD